MRETAAVAHYHIHVADHCIIHFPNTQEEPYLTQQAYSALKF